MLWFEVSNLQDSLGKTEDEKGEMVEALERECLRSKCKVTEVMVCGPGDE